MNEEERAMGEEVTGLVTILTMVFLVLMAPLYYLGRVFNKMKAARKEKREDLPKKIHALWSHWMKHFIGQMVEFDNCYILKKDDVDQWKRQMNTSYEELSEKEKESDIKLAIQWKKKALFKFGL